MSIVSPFYPASFTSIKSSFYLPTGFPSGSYCQKCSCGHSECCLGFAAGIIGIFYSPHLALFCSFSGNDIKGPPSFAEVRRSDALFLFYRISPLFSITFLSFPISHIPDCAKLRFHPVSAEQYDTQYPINIKKGDCPPVPFKSWVISADPF